MGHFYVITFSPSILFELFLSVIMIGWNENKLDGLVGAVCEGQGIDGTCALPLPGVQTHHEIRAGTLGRCLATSLGADPRWGQGWILSSPDRGPTCVGADGPGLARHPCFFACTYWPALHGQASRGRREEVEVGREDQGLQAEKTGVGHCTAAK